MTTDSYADQRELLQRVTAHILARRLHQVTGRFGLRPTPGGWGTPQLSIQRERLRVSGGLLIREEAGSSSTETTPLHSSSLADLGTFADVDLSADFSVGHDTPDLGDTIAPLRVSSDAVQRIANWFSLANQAIDGTIAAHDGASMTQLWPEHFDVGVSLAYGPGKSDRVNIGGSPGDAFHQEPYLYVGPWSTTRPNDESYWNAPFGAVLGEAALTSGTDALGRAVQFFETGVEALQASIA